MAEFPQLPIEVQNNADHRAVYLIKDDTVPPVAIDLTGSTFELDVRRSPTHPETLIQLTLGNGISFVGNPTAGQLQLSFPRVGGLERLGAGTYYYDLIRFLPNGEREVLWVGTLIVLDGTTR